MPTYTQQTGQTWQCVKTGWGSRGKQVETQESLILPLHKEPASNIRTHLILTASVPHHHHSSLRSHRRSQREDGKMGRLLFMLVGICWWRLSSAYSDGSVAAVCDSMLPGHNGITPQTTTPPYRVRVSRSTYRPGDRISVTLEAAQNGTHLPGLHAAGPPDSGRDGCGLFQGRKHQPVQTPQLLQHGGAL
ncbi:hypothetical protein AOLI_G00298190 [Acnodon oligacanthus]